MFDDFVEHATDASGPPAPLTLAPLQYEGFEPDDVHSNFDPQDNNIGSAVATAPIFDFGRVQYTFPAPLVAFAVCSDLLAMGLSSNAIILIELSHPDQVIKIQLPPKPTEMTIHKLFMDPSGRHIIVTSLQGQNWYLYRTWKKPRQLKGFKMVIESIAWNKPLLLSSSQSTSTREILIGARNGIIHEAILDAEDDFFKSQERYLQSVFTLPEKQPITGLRFDLFPLNEQKRAFVLVTTPTRIYQFVGAVSKKNDEGRIFSSLFAAYRDGDPKLLELPGSVERSELQFHAPSNQPNALPRTMAWLTGQGIYNGTLKFESDAEDQIDSAQLLPFPAKDGSNVPIMPISIALTEFHFLLLYKDRIMGVCNLNDKVVYEDALPLGPNETVLGLATDPVRKTYWIYTDQSLFELSIGNEDRDVWRLYLQKGNHETALQYAKTASQRDEVLASQADALFDQSRFLNAAHCYARSSTTFEEVALKFLDVGERDALRSYLILKLERTRKTDMTQRMMLATWLVEIYLSRCNELDDIIVSQSVSNDVDNLQAERTLVEDDLKQFLDTYKNNLDPKTIYQLIQGHGRTDIYLYYANIVGDHERVIEYWVLEEEWDKPIEIISRQSNPELYYKFGTVLMRHAPKETVDSWLRQPLLDPVRLVPALLQTQHALRDPLSPNHAIRYLNHVIFEQQNTSSTVHNLLITFYVAPSASNVYSPTTEDDGPLLRFLANAPTNPITGKPYYDLDYALRLCKRAGRTHPCVHIYSKMGMWENSVDLALEKGDLELAKINADMPDDDIALRKRLWLKIARYVVQDKKDIRSAMRFLENTDLLKIEDILPFFPDFAVIDDFKEEIAHALEGYSAHIESLRKDMDDATRTAEAIKDDIAALKNRFITIDSTEFCASCSRQLLIRQFYVFPCRHCFHADCLIVMAKEYLPPHALRKIVSLQDQLVDKSPGSITPAKTPTANPPRQAVRQRTLLSANFGLPNPLQNGARAANLLGRSVLSAGDRFRDLIVPDALAALVMAPATWIPGIGGGHRPATNLDENKIEKLRAELEDILAGSCPLCESVVVGLDKPFIRQGEIDNSWTL
ncbi:hypothetical protein M378DRAFT_155409 [Amanita muscaria Koide BX008]|uniref:Uncharacterized protein n=1 Tax=Amanita muscaria (strain Koide BX008) TaxID=946122 RepID=A0A0C2TWG4_AMAMK|nr:hypothetical protein M378DRAFT_155409 [Amanita muscaria Koide BX008]